MATSSVPSKAQCIFFNVPSDTTVGVIMNAFQVAAGPGGLKYLQHHGCVRFIAPASTMPVTERLPAQGISKIGDAKVVLEPVDARFFHVFRVPLYVTEETLMQALSPYRKVMGFLLRDLP